MVFPLETVLQFQLDQKGEQKPRRGAYIVGVTTVVLVVSI